MRQTTDTLYRQWLMLQFIPRHPGKTTASEIANRLSAESLGVTARTVQRDLKALSAAFPLTLDERNKPFGWSWSKNAPSMSVPGMSPLQAMVLGLAHAQLAELVPAQFLAELQPYFQQAATTLQAQADRGLVEWTGRVAVVPASQPLLPAPVVPDVLPVVHGALLRDRCLRISYRALGAKRAAAHTVHPLGLVQRSPSIYLVCRFDAHDDVAALPLHRILSAEELDQRTVPPEGFTLADFVAGGAMGFFDRGDIRLVIRMRKEVADQLQETRLADDQAIAADRKQGWLRISATVRDTAQLHWWLLSFGGYLEVLKPARLRRQVAENIGSAASLYRGRTPRS